MIVIFSSNLQSLSKFFNRWQQEEASAETSPHRFRSLRSPSSHGQTHSCLCLRTCKVKILLAYFHYFDTLHIIITCHFESHIYYIFKLIFLIAWRNDQTMVEEVLSAKWNGMFLQRFTSPYFILWLAVLHPKGFLKTRFHPKGLLLSFLLSFPFQL